MSITEDIVELAALETLQEIGWSYLHGSVIAPDGSAPERRSFGDVLLVGRLETAVARINPDAPESARNEAMRRVLTGELPSLVEENRRIHKLLTEGVDVEFRGDDGKTASTKIWLIDLGNPDADQRTVVSQPYGNGINSMEGEMDNGQFRRIRGFNNGGNFGGGGGIGGGGGF